MLDGLLEAILPTGMQSASNYAMVETRAYAGSANRMFRKLVIEPSGEL